MAFIGRYAECAQLESLKKTKKANLVVITGRRRIGKSALVQHFAQKSKYFYEFQGLAPRAGMDNVAQLKNFAEQMQQMFGGAIRMLSSWTEAFAELAKEIGSKPAIIFLDELSWMGKYDPDFVGKLKISWDKLFSKIPGLFLVLCGSVSSWIEENILQETDFIGRISLTIRLSELDLISTLNFWGESSKRISLAERLAYVCVTGGVPKYLEEYDLSQTTAANIKRLCFTKGGYLFEDFSKIFSDIFGRKSEGYRAIVRMLTNSRLTPQELIRKLHIKTGGEVAKQLLDLELSGFVARDYSFKPGGERGKLSKLRISDNYLRFYLKYLEPHKSKIEKGILNFSSLNDLLAWESIRGLQFENIIINRVPEIIKMLGLEKERIISAGPYFQTATERTKACQVDFMVECRPSNFFIAEIKCREHISTKVIDEMKTKIATLKLPKHSTARPVLIYFGDLSEQVRDADYFDKILNMAELLN